MTIVKKHFRTIDEYIASFPKDVQRILQELRSIIKESAPMAKETINYGIPTFILNGNLVHFAAFKNHIGFYPTPSAITAFRKELAQFKQAKGSVQFSMDQPIPFEVIKRIVAYRVKENVTKRKDVDKIV
ncbi:MAG: DUF1801 domain-containing protein [Thermoplasmatota archaeon]